MNGLFTFLAVTFPTAVAKIIYGAVLGPMLAKGLMLDIQVLVDALNNVAALSRGETPVWADVSQQQLAEGIYEVLEPSLVFMSVPLSAEHANQVLNALATLLAELHPPETATENLVN